MMATSDSDLFPYGSEWIRADFHLHTKADTEFSYAGEKEYYFSNYVDALEQQDIRIGAITNHNKFDYEEFVSLRKNARNKGILLMPGVELSVSDGANGIHVLVVFDDTWIKNGSDHINPLLATLFPGKTPQQYQTENGRSDRNLLQVVEELQKTGREYFLLFAHVEDSKGLWHEYGGGKISDLREPRYQTVREKVLGFQKVRTHDVTDGPCRVKVKQWLDPWYPAEIEGSDPKNIGEIGKGAPGYLKIGYQSFDAVRFALQIHKHRVSQTPGKQTNSHIKSIHFEGGTFDGTTIRFSPQLNTLIGIRGSGKSSILEVLRYVLEIPFGEKSSDREYKEALVGYTMGSGGKAVVTAVDRNGQSYEIHRVWKENYSKVLIGNKLQPGISIQETILRKPIYFGQKDLSNTGEGFERDLIDKLIGGKLNNIRAKITDQKIRVAQAVDNLLKLTDIDDMREEQEKIKNDTTYRLGFYTAHGMEEKLEKRLGFDTDIRVMKEGIGLVEEFTRDLNNLLAGHEDEIKNFTGYSSKQNNDLFTEFYTLYNQVIAEIDAIKALSARSASIKQDLRKKLDHLIVIRQSLVDEFADIERKLAQELKTETSLDISSEEFFKLKQKLAQAEKMLKILNEQGEQKTHFEAQVYQEMHVLNQLWHEEFTLIKTELDTIGAKNSSLVIQSGYKEDKTAFLDFMKSTFRGSNIRESTFRKIVDTYADFIEIYEDFPNAQALFGSNPHVFAELFMRNLKILATYQTPNKFSIIYHGKELQHHSLGQRASALILFVLSQGENDVIIIDQPEDDLDNQTIYEDVVKLIREMKKNVQFIFATHNPNIPVLGDSEQIHACAFMDDSISLQSGSIDDPKQQQKIVEIMEGGEEAFNLRREIYRIWKS